MTAPPDPVSPTLTPKRMDSVITAIRFGDTGTVPNTMVVSHETRALIRKALDRWLPRKIGKHVIRLHVNAQGRETWRSDTRNVSR